MATNYANLLTSEHSSKPKFSAMVGLVTQCFGGLNDFLSSFLTEFDLDSARWKQLDAIGARVGLDRNLRTVVPGVYSPQIPAGAVPFSDSDYTTLIRGKIAANQWDSTISGFAAKLSGIIGTGTGYTVFLQDNQDMSFYVCVAGAIPSASFKAALSGGYMQIRPAGVSAMVLYPTAPGGALFGFDVSNSLVQGLDAGVWSSTT